MSDAMVLLDRYAAFKMHAERLQNAIDALEKAEPDQAMLAMIKSLQTRRDVVLTDCESIRIELSDMVAREGR